MGDLTSLGGLISTVGFPIVGCIFLGIYCKGLVNKFMEYTAEHEEATAKQNDEYLQLINNMHDKYDTQLREVTNELSQITAEYNAKIDKVANALDQNTQVIHSLKEELEHIKRNN